MVKKLMRLHARSISGAPRAVLDSKLSFTLAVLAGRRKEQDIALALMIPLVMKMLHVLCQHMAERRLPKQDQPCETLLLDRSHPPLRVGV
jgi:hypothetical protein